MKRIIVLYLLFLLLFALACSQPTSNQNEPQPNVPVSPTIVNHPPIIDRLISEFLQIEYGQTSQIKCVAHDPDGDTLSYRWLASKGTILGEGDLVTFQPPQSYGTFLIDVQVTDGKGGTATKQYALQIVSGGQTIRNPGWPQ